MRRQPKSKRNNAGPRSGRLRIVAGKWRSRLLPIPDVDTLRPTPERIRETLFNWLAPVIEGSRCLDLFAGTGALGFEALSRGAASVTFVDNSPAAVDSITDSLRTLRADNAEVHREDALQLVRHGAVEPFDIVFLDPPFAADLAQDLCRLLADKGWLASRGYVYLEQEQRQSIPELPAGWSLEKKKKTGNVCYSLILVA